MRLEHSADLHPMIKHRMNTHGSDYLRCRMEMIGHIAKIVLVTEIGQAIAIFGNRIRMLKAIAIGEEENE